jgi:hypothetical protein
MSSSILSTGQISDNSKSTDNYQPSIEILQNSESKTGKEELQKQFKGVSPLLTIAWSQTCYYNDMCPVDSSGLCYHTRTGCGATAMAMIMKYWDFPVNGYGSNFYESPAYGIISADFENTYYDWNNMPPQLNPASDSIEIQAVAQLMFHCGVAVNMVYGANASSSDEWNIRNAYTNYFNYSSFSQYLDKADFSDSAWTAIMKNEIDNGRPVFYGISSGSGGHFVVMDGYNDDGYFHFNWGYGNMNGYYKTFDELPVIQEAIIGIEPNSDTTSGNTEFIACNGIFNDGSNHSSYPNGKNYFWKINPSNGDNVILLFTKFATEHKNDFVRIYDGPTTSSPLLGTYSGHNLPPVIITSSNQALIEFETNDSIEDSGWELRYTVNRSDIACSGITVYSDSTGTFDDGSGTSSYIDNADCFYLIKPDSASSVTLHFNDFYTETDWDFLYVYEGENPSPDNLLATLTGNISPADIISAKGSMLLHFHSDWNTNRPGWNVSYSADYDRLELDVKILLEGAFNDTAMNTLITEEILLNQPFDTNPAAIWYYEGTEKVDSVPSGNIVDWVLLEFRNGCCADSAKSKNIIARKAVFLLNDGKIKDLDGTSNPVFNISTSALPYDSIYLSVYHRNHIAVLSSHAITEESGVCHYDFTTGTGKAYQNNEKLINGKAVLYSGDFNGDGVVDNDDLLFWKSKAGNRGYITSDGLPDNQTDNNDKNDIWLPNIGINVKMPD